MPTAQYTALANVTLAGSASTVTFTSISQAYRDLILVINPSGNQIQDATMAINGSTANFSGVRAIGYGGTASAGSYSDSTGITVLQDNANSLITIHFIDYAQTDKHKILLNRINRPNESIVSMGTHRWASTSAITSIQLIPSSPYTYSAGATFALYGVK